MDGLRHVRLVKGAVDTGKGVLIMGTKAPLATLVKTATLAIKEKDFAAALAAIDEGEKRFPEANIPGGVDNWLRFREIAHKLAEQETAQETAPEVHPRHIERLDNLKAVPVTEQETEQETAVHALTIRHTLEGGTFMLTAGLRGEVGKRISRIMGKDGQRWGFGFNLSGQGAGWYIRDSRGGGADMPRILAAQKALNASDEFTATLDLHTTDDQGRTVAPKLSKAETVRRAREFNTRASSLRWHLTTEGGLSCSGCDTPGLHTATARLVTNGETGMPVVKCLPCAGEAEVLPEQETEPTPLVLDVQDDESEAVQLPWEREDVPPAYAPKSAPKQAKAAPKASGLESLDLDVLVALAKMGDRDAGQEIIRRAGISAPTAPKTAAPRTRKPVEAPVSAVPVSAVPVAASGPIELTADVLENAKVRQTASDVRRNLYAQVTNASMFRKLGVEIHVFADRSARTLKVTINAVHADAAARQKIAAKAFKVIKGTLGVAVESLATI